MLPVVAFIGGILTILSPCILPVIPLVFARTGRSFPRETLPMLVGLALAFTASALVATTAVRALLGVAEIGRYAALVLLGVVGVALVSDRVATMLGRPITAFAARASSVPGSSWARNVGIGAAIGLLWAPCAGPVLGVVIAAAATSSRVVAASLFFSFALGAATIIGALMLLGNRGLTRLRTLGLAERGIRRSIGVLTLATVVALAFGWDRLVFANASFVQTASAEEALVSKIRPSPAAPAGAMSLDEVAAAASKPALSPGDGSLAPFDGATEWINSPPLTVESLRGKVVLVDFWTFACYNCLNALPHVKELYAKYKDKGLVVVGVHTPELAHERVLANVRDQVKKLGITYPVVIDNEYKIWNAYHNQYWPAAYYADVNGKIRFYHFGEGRYDEQDQVIAKLLAEAKLASAR